MVVGAGPAGCSAALRAIRLRPDWDIALVERLEPEKHARYHRMCGEGISAIGLKELDFDTGPYNVHHISKAVEHWPGDITISTKIDGRIIDRPRLLAAAKEYLRSKGVLLVDANVTSTSQKKEGAEIGLENGMALTADWLIAADGARSRVREILFQTTPRQMIWADQYVIEERMNENEIEFYYDERFEGGYRWRFPNGPTVRTGFPKGTGPVPEGAVETHRRAIPIGEVDELVKGRVALVGDAAGQVNPITFGGIRTAFAAGRMAAEAAVKGDISRYQRAWRSSKYSHPCFWEGYGQLCDMNNDMLRDSMEPFRNGYSFSSGVRAMRTNKKYRTVYRSYARSMKVGW